MKTRIYSLLLSCCVLAGGSAQAQQRKTKNIILVTIDGCRWLEVFKGVDSSLLNDPNFMKAKLSGSSKTKYWAKTEVERRQKLMPFLWSEFAGKGRIYGNRDLNSTVQVKNPYNVSYPGYAEIYTGYPDPAIKSNDLVLNPNPNLFEYLNKQPGFEGKVASFISWNAGAFYLNKERSGFLVNSGYEQLSGKLSPLQESLNEMTAQWPITISPSSRPDAITYQQAKEYMRLNHPRALGIGFAYTDDYAHNGEYGLFVEQVHAFDAMIGGLWKFVQADPFYKDKTTILVTIDHGRGYGPAWTSHGPTVAHANETWFAILGPDTAPGGEMKGTTPIYQYQYAQTLARMLGLEFKSSREIGPAITELLK